MAPLQGYFTPRHPEKYEGNVRNIIFRSGLELRAMKRFDEQPNVLSWSSEETIIPYYDPVLAKYRRYFVDFQVTCRLQDGATQTYLIEVKPFSQIGAPTPPKKKNARSYRLYENKVATFLTNSAKWKAAEEYCAQRKWKFLKWTEKELTY